jgi:hypothetical protein
MGDVWELCFVCDSVFACCGRVPCLHACLRAAFMWMMVLYSECVVDIAARYRAQSLISRVFVVVVGFWWAWMV